MLKQTFCHIPGIGYKTEQQLWNSGVTTWEELARRTSLVTRTSDFEIRALLEESLLAYSIEDTVNLERLMVEAYNRNVARTPFVPELLLPFPKSPQIVHQADPEILSRMQQRYCCSF